jgi:hypothetical protein
MVYNAEEERRIVQYHFTDWPDRGVPISPQAFVKFVRTVMGTQQKAQRSVTASTVRQSYVCRGLHVWGQRQDEPSDLPEFHVYLPAATAASALFSGGRPYWYFYRHLCCLELVAQHSQRQKQLFATFARERDEEATDLHGAIPSSVRVPLQERSHLYR